MDGDLTTSALNRGCCFLEFLSARQALSIRAMMLALAIVLAGLVLPSAAIPSPLQQTDSQDKPAAKPAEAQEKSPPEVPVPLPRGKRLVLKDGNYHLVRSYERKGDRVRYYSVERSAWEEIPADLVDWKATQKAEAEDAKHQQELVEKMHADQAAERAAEIDVGSSIEVAPGVFLPENEGMYVVEGKFVEPMTQSTANLKLDKGRLLTQVLVPIPVVPSRRRVQVPGKRAELRLTTDQPEFYMRVDTEDDDRPSSARQRSKDPGASREPELELIHAEVKGDARVIELISTYIVGESHSNRNAISIQRWTVARGVYRITLSQPLEPGEYALAEILPEGMNLYVWDFGVDPPGQRPSTPPKRPEQKKPKQ